MEPADAPATPDSILAFTADRFVDRLYPSLAWEATIQLGDPALASRLVERILRRAWVERERFATADALQKHARDAAHEAIAREAERRQHVTAFDDAAPQALQPPGDLQVMSAAHVHRRLVEHSTRPDTTPTPPTRPSPHVASDAIPPVLPLTAAPTPDDSAPGARPALVAPTARATPHPATVAASTEVAPATVTGRAALDVAPLQPATLAAFSASATSAVLPLRSPSAPAASPAVATDAPRRIVMTPEPAVARVAARSTDARHPTGVRERPHLRAASYLMHDERLTFRPRVVGLALAGVALSAALAFKVFGGPSPDVVALEALQGPAGVSATTSRGEQRIVELPDGSQARLGAEASLRASKSFAEGARALTVVGPARLSVADREQSPLAVGTGDHRWVIAGGAVSFQPDGDRMLVRVDSGVVTHVGAESRTPIEGGQAIAVGADGAILPLEGPDQDAPFAWQRGRLQLRGASVLVLRERLQEWFDLDLRFATPRAPSETITLDVPLQPTDSVLAVLAMLGDGVLEREGSTVTVGARQPRAARPATPARRATATSRTAVPPMPRIQPLPTIPEH